MKSIVMGAYPERVKLVYNPYLVDGLLNVIATVGNQLEVTVPISSATPDLLLIQ